MTKDEVVIQLIKIGMGIFFGIWALLILLDIKELLFLILKASL